MIHVKRINEPFPNESLQYEKQRLNQYLEHLKEIYANRSSQVLNTSRRFYPENIMDVDSNWFKALYQQFNGKCAYCETYLDSTEAKIEYFRPIDGVFETQSNVYDHHYSWLIYEWSNLHLSCKECSSYKKNYFPLEGNRAYFGKNVRHEKNLLIDPCIDLPEEHLYFESNGKVCPRNNKGDTSIGILDLNRPSLVEARYSEVSLLKYILRNEPFSGVLKVFQHNSPYIAIKKQVLAEWLLKEVDRRELRELYDTPEAGMVLKKVFGRFQNLKQLTDLLRNFTARNLVTSVSEAQYRVRRIEKIEIYNIRGITARYEFKLNDKESSWLMLLGENGTGKTTFLQVIALAVAEHWNRVNINSHSFVPKNEEGYVAIKFQYIGEPVVLRFRNGDFDHEHDGIEIPIAAYGAVRLFPKNNQRREIKYDGVNIKNLFPNHMGDYFLVHPSKWIKDEETMETVAQAILDVLPFNEHDIVDLSIEGGQAFLTINGQKRFLHELSSGYQNIIAITVDIMRTIGSISNRGRLSEGLVIIDEIDAHLHPSWKLVIVNQLKKTFPYIQFIVTSHDPLCLRGLKQEEILVMKKVEQEVHPMEGHPDPKQLRIDQLLTSSMFGLHSTIEQEIDRAIKQYYYLINKEDKTEQDIRKMQQIESRLDKPDIKYLGYTNRERLLYEVIDSFIAKRLQESKPYHEMDEETQRKLIRIWNLEEEENS